MRSDIKFYDTSSLLLGLDEIFEKEEKFAVSSITLKELENIKTSAKKDFNQKYQARKLLHLLTQNPDKYEVWIYKTTMITPIEEANLDITDDMRILATALDYKNSTFDNEVIFVTNDVSLFKITSLFFKKEYIQFYEKEEKEEYHGYLEVYLNSDDMADFYSTYTQENKFNLLLNEYLIIHDAENNNEVVDVYKKTESGLKQIFSPSLDSKMFGHVKPKDVYQRIAIDSLMSNQMTMLGGPAGSGKSLLALACLFSKLERGIIDKIIIFVNPVGAKDCAKLGFYKGDVREKILSTQAGHVLSSKLGDMEEVNRLLDYGQLEIIPAVDSRGYEVPPNSGVYILEAQNLTSSTMRMLLQRVSEEAQVIIDGDRTEQVDMDIYAEDNGMKKVNEIFRGEDIYGQVDLQSIYRSKIANIADKMR